MSSFIVTVQIDPRYATSLLNWSWTRLTATAWVSCGLIFEIQKCWVVQHNNTKAHFLVYVNNFLYNLYVATFLNSYSGSVVLLYSKQSCASAQKWKHGFRLRPETGRFVRSFLHFVSGTLGSLNQGVLQFFNLFSSGLRTFARKFPVDRIF